jgi:4-carboxymuconolactone decarboxylase
MTRLNKKERELAALGAALASNCRPCIVFHVREAREAGLSDPQVMEAIELAQKVKQVPADRVLEAAYAQLSCERPKPETASPADTLGCGC